MISIGTGALNRILQTLWIKSTPSLSQLYYVPLMDVKMFYSAHYIYPLGFLNESDPTQPNSSFIFCGQANSIPLLPYWVVVFPGIEIQERCHCHPDLIACSLWCDFTTCSNLILMSLTWLLYHILILTRDEIPVRDTIGEW